MKYLITKKCYANEFVMVEAESEAEALEKAKEGKGRTLGSYLEFNGYQDSEKWNVDEMPKEAADNIFPPEEEQPQPPTSSEHKEVVEDSVKIEEVSLWNEDKDYGQQSID